MPAQLKKVLIWGFWIFLAYAIVTSPDRAADIAKAVWAIIASGFSNLGIFFDRLINR